MITSALPSFVRNTVVRVAKSGLSSELVWQYLVREWSANDLLVLTYHQIGDEQSGAPISTKQFATQIEWLASKCEFMHANDLPDFFAGRLKSKRPMVMLTFDDGHRCLYENVYPILRRHSLPAVAFLATGPITDGDYLWTDDIRRRIGFTNAQSIELPIYGNQELTDQERRQEVARTIVNDLKRRPDSDRTKIASILRQKVPLPVRQAPMISWDQAREMGDVFHWGAHTHSHPILSRVSPSVARNEIVESKRILVEKTGQAVNLFAYPNGTREDYNETIQEILQQEGFLAAFTTNPGFVSGSDNMFELDRCPTTAASLNDFAWMTARPSRLS